MNTKIIGIIPARYASQRFPGKPLIDLKGKSMVQRVYEQAVQCEALDKVVIATDDIRIYEHCETKNLNVVMTGIYHQSGTDRCAEALGKVNDQFDIIVNIQGDEPLIEPQQITEVISLFDNDSVKIGSLVRRIKEKEQIQNPNVVKATFDKYGKALYFSRSPIPFNRNENENYFAFQHLGIYAFRVNTLKNLVQLPVSRLENIEKLEQLRWLENGYSLYLKETNYVTYAIDTPEDVDNIINLLF